MTVDSERDTTERFPEYREAVHGIMNRLRELLVEGRELDLELRDEHDPVLARRRDRVSTEANYLLDVIENEFRLLIAEFRD